MGSNPGAIYLVECEWRWLLHWRKINKGCQMGNTKKLIKKRKSLLLARPPTDRELLADFSVWTFRPIFSLPIFGSTDRTSWLHRWSRPSTWRRRRTWRPRRRPRRSTFLERIGPRSFGQPWPGKQLKNQVHPIKTFFCHKII